MTCDVINEYYAGGLLLSALEEKQRNGDLIGAERPSKFSVQIESSAYFMDIKSLLVTSTRSWSLLGFIFSCGRSADLLNADRHSVGDDHQFVWEKIGGGVTKGYKTRVSFDCDKTIYGPLSSISIACSL